MAHVSKLDSLFDPVNCFLRGSVRTQDKQMDIFARWNHSNPPWSKFLDISQTLLVANPYNQFFEAFSFRAGGFFQNNSSILPAFIEFLGILGRKTRRVFGVVLGQVTVV